MEWNKIKIFRCSTNDGEIAKLEAEINKWIDSLGMYQRIVDKSVVASNSNVVYTFFLKEE